MNIEHKQGEKINKRTGKRIEGDRKILVNINGSYWLFDILDILFLFKLYSLNEGRCYPNPYYHKEAIQELIAGHSFEQIADWDLDVEKAKYLDAELELLKKNNFVGFTNLANNGKKQKIFVKLILPELMEVEASP